MSNPTTQPLLRSVTLSTLPPATTTWLLSLLSALDSKNLDLYLSFFSPNITMQFNNSPPINGLDGVRGYLSDYWATFGSLRHEELNIVGVGDGERCIVHEALNHYVVEVAEEGGEGKGREKEVTVRAVAWIERDERGMIEGLRVYGDVGPVFEAGKVKV